jgi:hypothetical protein
MNGLPIRNTNIYGGCHTMVGKFPCLISELNPCSPGCAPAIRDFVNDKNVTAEYHATKTGKTISWEKMGDSFVLQTERSNGGRAVQYKHNINTRKTKCK